MSKTYDAIVIGGGAVGIHVAYQLSKRGCKVALLDKTDVAGGSSSRCSASILVCDKDPGEETDLGYASMMITKQIQEEASEDFEFAQRGSLCVCETEEEVAVAQRYVEQQSAAGFDMKMVTPAEMADIEPNLAKDLVGGFWTTPDATVNPYKMCFSMAEECKKMGAEILNKCQVTGILRDEKGKVTGVETTNGTILTDTIIVCAGVWTPEIGRMVGIDIPIFPRKGLMLVSERGPIIAHQAVHEYGYMLTVYGDSNYERKVSERVKKNEITFQIEPMEAGNFIMGGSHGGFVGLDVKSEIEVMQAVAERGIRFFPIIREVNCIRSYCGVRPHTDAHIPFICGVDEVPGFYVCSGHEGDGIAMSGISGKLMAQVIAGEETDFDMAQFDLKRGY